MTRIRHLGGQLQFQRRRAGSAPSGAATPAPTTPPRPAKLKPPGGRLQGSACAHFLEPRPRKPAMQSFRHLFFGHLIRGFSRVGLVEPRTPRKRWVPPRHHPPCRPRRSGRRTCPATQSGICCPWPVSGSMDRGLGTCVYIRPDVLDRVAAYGSLGLGEAYMDGDWECDRLDGFFARVLRARLDRRVKPLRLLPSALLARLHHNHQKRAPRVAGRPRPL